MKKKLIITSLCTLASLNIFFAHALADEKKNNREANIASILAFADLIDKSQDTLLKSSENLSKIGNSVGVNPETIAFLDRALTNGIKIKADEKIPVILTMDTEKTTTQLSALMKQAGYVIGGVGTFALSLMLAGLIANKHINHNDAQFTQKDGVATCISATLAVGAWLLIKYSA